MKFKIKREDEVVVIAGDEKGKRGKVLDVQREKMRVL
ncbi:MAG: KOW motif-containing protein, partial [Verrucomicrobiota bacterium]